MDNHPLVVVKGLVMKRKKLGVRFLAFLLAVIMSFGSFPAMVHAAEEDDNNYITVSIEKYDADGNGGFILEPKRSLKERWVNDDVGDALRQAIGSTYQIELESDYDTNLWSVIGVYDSTQDDEWLRNGELGENSKWEVLIDNTIWSGVRYNSNYYLQGGEVLRLVFTADGGNDIGLTDGGLEVNKDDLVKLVGEVSKDIWFESDPRYEAYQAALDTIVNPGATQEDVTLALNNLKEALIVPAASVNIAADSMEIGLGKSKTLTATLEPSVTTDTIVWSTEDTDIVSVDAKTGEVTGLAEGTAIVTATAGSVSDSIEITVKIISATGIAITNGDSVSVEARFSVQLEATVEPEDSTNIIQWSVADESIATVNSDGKLTGVKPGTTTVTATAGSVTDTCEITVTETVSPYIYFQYHDGRIQEMKDDTFTLTALDEGKFIVGNYENEVDWECSDTAEDESGGYGYRYWISSSGTYNPFGIKKMQATVSGLGLSKTFYIDAVSSGITEIKAYINDEEINEENPYETTGTVSNIPVTVKGLNADNEWVTVPVQAVRTKSTDTTSSIRVYDGKLQMHTEGSATITISMVDNSNAIVSFDAICNTVAVTGMTVSAPDSFVIDKWDNMINGYIGITHGYENENIEYHVVFTPYNATNQNVIWEALTPEIAEFYETHSAGIVPKKAGTARFIVKSESNPDVTDEVEITFSYKTPLESALSSQDSYEMNAGETINLELTFTPSNATETRFNWTYSQNGIVRVTESVTADTYNRYISRKIIAVADGTVTVTGTPLDNTAGCEPVVFIVKVGSGSSEIEKIDYLQMAKDDIAHGLEYLSTHSQDSYGDEWNIFTILRSGGTVSKENIDAYLVSVKDKLDNSSSSLAPTDYARMVLTLTILGENPTSFKGHNLIETLYSNTTLGNMTSNQICWTLIALDCHDYDIPKDAVWTRDKLIERILECKAADGSFAFGSGASTGSVDMTGMVLQSLAPYNTDEYPEVQAAFADALVYLQNNMTENVGYIEGGAENGCTTAQVLTAFAAANMDPTDKTYGLTLGTKNLITNLDSFKLDSGFAYLSGSTVNMMGTQQITYAMEAYRRYAENENVLYDLTDIEIAQPMTDKLTVTADGKNCTVKTTGITSYMQAEFGKVNAPVYKTKVRENTDFTVNWNFNSDGGDDIGRYVFAIDAGGDVAEKKYPFTMTMENIDAYILSAEEIVAYFGENTGLDLNNQIAFLEIYDTTEITPNLLYGLFVEFVPESMTKEVVRIYGETRIDTSFEVADALKEELGVNKFDTVIVATSKNFADALSGSYLAAVNDAPILLTSEKRAADLHTYIQTNVREGGTVYILGGTAALPESIEAGLEGYVVRRLSGSTRYETNLEILKEADVTEADLLVCTGKDFADSLSASAVKKPLLLVKDTLTDSQKEFLDTLSEVKVHIIGGKNAVSADIVEELANYGTVDRTAGATRSETSVKVAEKFFEKPEAAVVAYAKEFPDGLCGGPLAVSMNAPLILTTSGKESAATAYMEAQGIDDGVVLGGTARITDDSARTVFGMDSSVEIIVK